MMTIIYHDSDANPDTLSQRQVALIGYGNLGRSLALNLRDSGIDLLIGNQSDQYADLAQNDGFEVYSIPQAVQQADTMFLIIPDEVLPQVYLKHIAPYLRTGDMLIFASGYNIVFGYIEPPGYVDIGMLAPRTLGVGVRDGYLTGLGFPSFLAIGQDSSGRAWEYLLALGQATGALRQGALEVTFNQEVELDLFAQQTILPAIHAILQAATQTLMREGYPPEAILTELYLSGEISLVLSQAASTGFRNAIRMMSPTAQFGLLSRTEQFRETKVQRLMESILDDIRQGEFARNWTSEATDGYPRLATLLENFQNTAMWDHEQEALQALRGLL
jgi:ketol-acid reductoisomerase